MNGVIIAKGAEYGFSNNEIKAYVEMRLSGLFDKVIRQPVGDSKNTLVLHVRTKKNNFETLRDELNEYYPKACVFLRKG